jgi:hypothetical protein
MARSQVARVENSAQISDLNEGRAHVGYEFVIHSLVEYLRGFESACASGSITNTQMTTCQGLGYRIFAGPG